MKRLLKEKGFFKRRDSKMVIIRNDDVHAFRELVDRTLAVSGQGVERMGEEICHISAIMLATRQAFFGEREENLIGGGISNAY